MEIRAKLKRGRVKSFTGNPWQTPFSKKKKNIPRNNSLKTQVCRVIPIKRVCKDGIGWIGRREKATERERSLHIRVPGESRWNIMDWNVDSFLSFACRLASQFSSVRQISRISRRRRRGTTRIHPISVTLSLKKKKKKKREDRKAVEVSLERGKPKSQFDENCHPFRSFHHAFPSSSVIFFSRIEIKKSYRWFEHFPSPFRIFHVAASLFSVYSLEL